MEMPLKGFDPQPLANPTADWSIERLGEYAAEQHRGMARDEQSLTVRYWRLGMALELARNKTSHGQWRHFLDAHHIDKTRASKARAIYASFSRAEELAGLTVEEAYALRDPRPDHDAPAMPEPER